MVQRRTDPDGRRRLCLSERGQRHYFKLRITFVPEYEEVIRNGAAVIAPGGRWVILDFKRPERWPAWLVRFGVLLTKPFGVTLDLADRHPWEAVNKYLGKTSFRELYRGFAYIAAGEKTA